MLQMKVLTLVVGFLAVACPSIWAKDELVISPSADSYVLGGKSSTENYGSDHTFLVRHSSNAAYNRIGYVQFPIGEIGDGQKLASASLILRLASVFRGRDTDATVQVYGLAAIDWEESRLTDDNAPVAAKMSESIPTSAATLLGDFTVPSAAQASPGLEFSVSGKSVVDYIDQARSQGARFVTFLIVEKDVTANSVAFIARENPSFQASTLELTLQ